MDNLDLSNVDEVLQSGMYDDKIEDLAHTISQIQHAWVELPLKWYEKPNPLPEPHPTAPPPATTIHHDKNMIENSTNNKCVVKYEEIDLKCPSCMPL